MMITEQAKRCGWCDDELTDDTVTVEHREYGTVCASHDELTNIDADDSDAVYEIGLDALLGVG